MTLKNNAPFISCISKINGELVENAEDLDIVIPMYNLLEYSKNYEKTSGSLFNYYRDEPSQTTIGTGNNAINMSIRNPKSFDHKTEIIGSLDAGEDEKEDVTIAIPLKYLGNFSRSLDIPLINRLFVLSFENEDDRTSYYKYYLPNVEIKDYNVLTDGNAFFELPIKNIEETYEKITQITDHSGYYPIGNLLDYEYFKEHCKLIAIDLSKQIEFENKDIKQQINFIGNLERDDGAVMFFIIEKSEETISEFSQNYASIV